MDRKMAFGKSSLISLIVALLVVNFVSDAKCRADAAQMFTLKASNSIREPKFMATASIAVDGRPLIRYMEDLVLAGTSDQFRSFETNFTAPYGALVTSINGVKSTWFVDKTYWEFFINHQAVSTGVSFYEPKDNDIIELTFTTDTRNRQPSPY